MEQYNCLRLSLPFFMWKPKLRKMGGGLIMHLLFIKPVLKVSGHPGYYDAFRVNIFNWKALSFTGWYLIKIFHYVKWNVRSSWTSDMGPFSRPSNVHQTVSIYHFLWKLLLLFSHQYAHAVFTNILPPDDLLIVTENQIFNHSSWFLVQYKASCTF